MLAVLAPELRAATVPGMSAPLSVPPAGTGRKGRKLSTALVHINAMYRVGGERYSTPRGEADPSWHGA
jgi:hypothetical protein